MILAYVSGMGWGWGISIAHCHTIYEGLEQVVEPFL
jgi:hypothetical protein